MRLRRALRNQGLRARVWAIEKLASGEQVLVNADISVPSLHITGGYMINCHVRVCPTGEHLQVPNPAPRYSSWSGPKFSPRTGTA